MRSEDLTHRDRAPTELDLASLGDIPDPLATVFLLTKSSAPAASKQAAFSSVEAKVVAAPHAFTRVEVRRRRLVALTVSLVWFAGLLLWAGLRTDFGVDRAALVGQILLPASLGPIAIYAALTPGRLGLGPRFEWLVGITLAAPVVFAVLALATAPSFDLSESTLVKHAFGCASIAVVLGLIPMFAAAYGLRRVCVTGAPWRSALVGIGIGLISASILGMHCSTSDGPHVLAGHVLPVLVLGLLATALVRRSARVE